jgi:hypothetical protein
MHDFHFIQEESYKDDYLPLSSIILLIVFIKYPFKISEHVAFSISALKNPIILI